jgi:ABC-type multidrug transport system fused ATPase/permease subunit
MVKKLLYASLSNFYNRIPTGRIVNRLTKDLRELDQSIMQAFLWVLMSGFQLIGSLAICVYTTTPIIILPIIIIGYLSNKLRQYYLKTQREVVRF